MTTAETKAETNDTAASVAEPGATAAAEKAAGKKTTSRKEGPLKRQKAATGGRSKKAKAAQTSKKLAGRPETKGAKILAMIGRAKGATLAEIMEATSWQAHSVRGFISTAGHKHGVKIDSTKNESGRRIYRIVP